MQFTTIEAARDFAATSGYKIRKEREKKDGKTELVCWDPGMRNAVLLVDSPAATTPEPAVDTNNTTVVPELSLAPETEQLALVPSAPALVPATVIIPEIVSEPASRVSGDRRHFSFSQLTKFMMCGLMYYFRYVLGLPSRKTTSLAFGSAIHAGIEHDLVQKIVSGVNIAFSEKEGAFEASFMKDWNHPDTFKEQWEKPDDYLKPGVALLKLHHDEIAVRTNPVAVEKRVEISIPGMDVPVLGFVDLIEKLESDELKVTDHKTAGQKYAEDEATLSYQLNMYAGHEKIVHTGYDVLLKTKTPKVQQINGVAKPAYVEHVKDVFRNTYAAVQKGIFLPAKPGDWPCSPKACEYWEICRGKYLN